MIAIDAGHGGSNLGAAGITIEGSGPDAGRTIFEKQITLALACRLRSQLAARGEYRVVLAARLIAARLGERLGRDASRGVRQAGASLDVLRGAGAPSALVEVGFIDHPAEGQLLASPAGQDVIAAALAAAVSDFAQQ